MANNKSTNAALFFWLNCNIGKSGFEMVRNALFIFIGLTIFMGKRDIDNVHRIKGHKKTTLESKTFQRFCESGEPEVINAVEIGKGEIKVDSISLARSWLVHVNVEENSATDINFLSFLLEDYFLVIQDGMGDGSNDSMVQIISGRSDEPLLFRIPFCQSFFMEVCPEYGPVLSSPEGYFQMSFIRTVFEDSLPDEKPNIQIEKESYEVQLKGHPPGKFKEPVFVWQLKEVIKKMAEVYCRESKLNFDVEKKADDMVTILAVRHCPVEWYDTDICASIKHSVYVTPEHKGPVAVWNYELRRKHLQEMWERVNDSDLDSLQLSIYRFPKKDQLLGRWSLLIIVPPVVLTLVSIFAMKIYDYFKEDRQMKHSAGSESMTTSTRRKSKLKPNKHQCIPSFVESQSGKSYSHKRQGQYNAEEQYVQQRSYMGAILFSKVHRGYSSYNNET